MTFKVGDVYKHSKAGVCTVVALHSNGGILELHEPTATAWTRSGYEQEAYYGALKEGRKYWWVDNINFVARNLVLNPATLEDVAEHLRRLDIPL